MTTPGIFHVKSQNTTNTPGTATVTVFNSAGLAVTAIASNLVQPEDWNSAHNWTFTLTGNTAGASVITGSGTVGPVFAASGNAGVMGTSNSLIISTPVASYWMNTPFYSSLVDMNPPGGVLVANSTSWCWPNFLPYAVNAQYGRLVNIDFSQNSQFNLATTNNTNFSYAQSNTLILQAFTCPNSGTDSNSFYQFAGVTFPFVQVFAVSAGAAGSNYTVSASMTYPGGAQGTTASTSFAFSTNSIYATNVGLAWSGISGANRYLDMPLSTQFPEGNYVFLWGGKSTTAGNFAGTASRWVCGGLPYGVAGALRSGAGGGFFEFGSNFASPLSSGNWEGVGAISSTTNSITNFDQSKLSIRSDVSPANIFPFLQLLSQG